VVGESFGEKPMKKIALAVLFAASSVFGATNDLRQTVWQEAQKCADALVAGDYDTMIAYTHPKIVEIMGGKEVMMDALKRGAKAMAAQGVAIEKVAMSVPDEPKTSDGVMYTLVTETLTVKSPDGKTIRESTMVALSRDAGKKWMFIDADSLNDPNMKVALPELVGKISPPASKPPAFIKDASVSK
jgi:ketosteroid isomerase-like protein